VRVPQREARKFPCEVAQNLALALLLLPVQTSPFSQPLGEIFSKTWNGYQTAKEITKEKRIDS